MKTGRNIFDASPPRVPRLALIAAVLSFAGNGPCRAQAVAAVLSSGSGYYKEVLAGFEKELGRPADKVFTAENADKVPAATGVVAAFGARAVIQAYPDGATLIYWAPGLDDAEVAHEGAVIKVSPLPRPENLLLKLKELQPGLKELRGFFVSGAYTLYAEKMKKAAAVQGMVFRADRLRGAQDLPGRLRAMKPKPDAIWLAPDPELINAMSFVTLKDYSLDNGVPLYAPSAGLVEQGATASVGADFAEIGRMAAVAAVKADAGESGQDEVYPEVMETSVNLTAAAKTGLVFSGDFLKTNVQKVFQ